jgi:hypothetical protein
MYTSEADRSVSAFAYNEPLSGTRIMVQNNSRYPVRTNYFLDEFYAITKSGDLRELEKCDILYYPDQSINPGEVEKFQMYDAARIEDTDAIFMSLNQDMFILLKPIP